MIENFSHGKVKQRFTFPWEGKATLYLNRTPRCHCHHRDLGCHTAACAAECPGTRQRFFLPQQHKAARNLF